MCASIKNPNGFVLFEVMLAVVVLGMGIASLFYSYSTALRGARISRERLEACLLLEDKVWELERLKAEALQQPVQETVLHNIEWGVCEAASEADAAKRWDVVLRWGTEARREALSLTACALE